MNVEDWVEYAALALLAGGVILALSAGSEALSYVFVVLAGLMFARLWFRWRKNMKAIIVFLMMGFLFGYVLGNVYGSRRLTAILFLASVWTGYEIHSRGYLKSLEF